uniref:Uncharacterized protein n=1 Tax=Metapenaeus joyneri majanivirus TaxID=2984280 RepID=A0A9C7C8W1_9VIRU|nr:MAG: hypothetical protein [Metapenaeus joyneri majanivirus]
MNCHQEILNIMCSSVPQHLKYHVMNLIKTSEKEESNTIRRKCFNNRKLIDRLAKQNSLYIAIAKLVMEVWSQPMKKHIESLIHQKAIDEGFLNPIDLKYVTCLDYTTPYDNWENWNINNNNDEIVKLLWVIYDMRQHFKKVHKDRMLIMKFYDILYANKGPPLDDIYPRKIMMRYDLTKFSLEQAIGYTLKNVHDCSHRFFDLAHKLHINNEPHHYQMWSFDHTAYEKTKKMKMWCYNEIYTRGTVQVPDSCAVYPHMPIAFLLEYLLSVVVNLSKSGEHDEMPLLYFTKVEAKHLKGLPRTQKGILLQFVDHLKDMKYNINKGILELLLSYWL